MTDSGEIVEASLLPPEGDTEHPPQPPAAPRRRPRAALLLAAALVLALAGGVLGAALWRDRGVTDGQAAAVSVVEQYTAALDTHDLAGMRATMADRASFAGGEHLSSPAVGPFSGKDLDVFLGSMFRAGVRLRTQGPVQVTGTGPYQVVAVQTVRYTVDGVAVTEQGVSLFTLLQLPDRPVILEHVWWPRVDTRAQGGHPAGAVSVVRDRLSP